ncbi:hypothetical protein N0V90_000697 [Kalmusia sp. IMI 367209]|nr:hypothetical protein N0V90_000697 [Kalmusia sp. IMI 367209]
MAMFHCRPIDAAVDFVLISPSTIEELGAYKSNGPASKSEWHFCKNCGVRTFGVAAQWVQHDLDVEKWAGRESKGKTQKVWRTKPLDNITGYDGKPLNYA